MIAETSHVDIKDLCVRFSLKPWTVRTWCSQGRIPHLKLGRKVLFDVRQIERWLEEHAQPVEELRHG